MHSSTDTNLMRQLPQLTMDQAIVLSVITGCVLTPMSNVLKDISERLGRKVTAEEFKSAEFIEEVKDLYREDLMKIIRPEKVSDLILPAGVRNESHS